MKRRDRLRAQAMEAEQTDARKALEQEAWVIKRAARRLGVSYSALQRILRRYPELRADWERHGQGRGRPRKDAKS